MKTVLSGLLLLGLFIAGCGKDDDPTPPPPPPPPPVLDTLYNWKKLTPGVGSDIIADVAAINQQTAVISASEGIFKTTDGGATWTKRSSAVFYNFFPLNAQHIIGEGTNEFSYSTDGGNTWTVRTVLNADYALNGFYTSLSTGYVNHNGLFKTTDSAKTWTKIYPNRVNAIYFSNADNGWIQSERKIFTTTNGGATWQFKGDIMVGNADNAGMQFTDAQHGNYFGNSSYARTNDGGATWTTKTFNNIIIDIHFVSNDVGYLSTGYEIYKTADGGNTWTISCKLSSNRIVDIHFLDANNGWACGFSGTLLQLKP
jgi:photosystem II stability/assembly factor-like uncharacterized protein